MTHTHYRYRTRVHAPPPTECNLIMSRPTPNLVRLCRPDIPVLNKRHEYPAASSIKITARLLFALVALLTSSPCLMGEAAQSAEASSEELLCTQGGYCSVGKVGGWSESDACMCRCVVHGEWAEEVFAGGGYTAVLGRWEREGGSSGGVRSAQLTHPGISGDMHLAGLLLCRTQPILLPSPLPPLTCYTAQAAGRVRRHAPAWGTGFGAAVYIVPVKWAKRVCPPPSICCPLSTCTHLPGILGFGAGICLVPVRWRGNRVSPRRSLVFLCPFASAPVLCRNGLVIPIE